MTVGFGSWERIDLGMYEVPDLWYFVLEGV